MKAIVCDRWGDPEEVLQVRDVPEPVPGRGEVRVRMLASPINPADLLMVRGQYGRQPPLPSTPGFEGVGVVEAGSGLLARRVMGRRVAVLNNGSGNWKEQVVIPARQAVPVPKEISDEQAATFFVNPATALILTHYVLQVPHGAWLLQTAAGSTLGRMVIRLGQHLGFRTLNVVRRREQAEELLRLGGTAAIATNDESLTENVQALTGGEGVRYAIDAVGGATGSEIVGVLARGGRLVVYGTLAGEPLSVESRALMVGQKRIEGFWLSEWVRDQKPWTMLWLFRQIGKLMRAGVLVSDVGQSFALTDIHAAVRQAAQPGRQGKVLLRIGAS
ncbi:MAG TPA: zinc-dependent alcohol dehydrogenase family protein [Gemmataceae bacterium]|nr:zinc-dependent alcohol dehydrogenase family protein [Gemmataceae bacterium]